jgi:hypothetical protein
MRENVDVFTHTRECMCELVSVSERVILCECAGTCSIVDCEFHLA